MTYLTIAPPVLPPTRLSVRELATLERFLKEASTLVEVDGYDSIPVGREGDNVDAAIQAWTRLRAMLDAAWTEPSTVFMLGQMEDAGWERLPNFRFMAETGLGPQVRVLQLKSGNASAPLDTVSLASTILARKPHSIVGLVASEKVNSRFVRRRIGSQIFGDAAVAALLSSAPLTDGLPTLRLLGEAVSLHDARFFEVGTGGLANDADFLACACRLSHEAVKLALADASVASSDVALCCTQNLSERVFRSIGAEQPLPGQPLRFREQIAHAPCADLLVNLSLAWSAGCLPRASVVVTLALGLGIGASAAVFQVN